MFVGSIDQLHTQIFLVFGLQKIEWNTRTDDAVLWR